MRLAIVCGMIFTLAVIAANGQNSSDQEREAICKKVACRDATNVKLKINDKEYAEFEFPKGPFVADGVINVLSGERFSVEFEEQDGNLINPRFVKENIHPDHTISVSLSQGEKGMVFAVSNPFPKPIIYNCAIQHYKQASLSQTSVVPVSPKSSTYEGWPYPISQIVISNLHFLPATGGIGPGNIVPGSKARVLSRPPPYVSEEETPQFPITIVLRAVLAKDATVTGIKLSRAIPEDAPKELVTLFTERAIAAAKLIKFIPATRDGDPVSMYVQLEYNFGPQKDQPKPPTKSSDTKESKPEEQVPGV